MGGRLAVRRMGEIKMKKIAIPAKPEDVKNYVKALTELGAEPVIISKQVSPDAYDGLLLPGGVDIDPKYYKKENIACGRLDPWLDKLQFAVLDDFVKAGKPVFGICRGHEVINVYFGGTLIQDIQTEQRHPATPEGDTIHSASAAEGSFIDRLYGKEPVLINSAHHQGVETLGRGLIPVMYAPDGIVEAMMHRSLPVKTVQWHPERLCFDYKREDTVDGSTVIGYFLNSL